MIVEIYTKDNYDFESKNLKLAISKFGSEGVFDVKVSKLYKIENIKNKKVLNSIVNDILIDPIVEECLVGDKKNLFFNKYQGYVEIFLKDSVADVVGESVSDIIERIKGLKTSVRIGKRFYYCGIKDRFLDFIKEEFFNELIHKISFKEF